MRFWGYVVDVDDFRDKAGRLDITGFVVTSNGRVVDKRVLLERYRRQE